MVYICNNKVFPDPESDNHLLTILLKVCESKLVERIGKFSFWLNDIELASPNAYGTECDPRILKGGNYSLMGEAEALQNKISGLLIESETDVKERIRNVPWFSHYIQPGLRGIRKAINYIKMLLNNNGKALPEYLKDIKLKNYRFFLGVIWKMNAHLSRSSDGSYRIMEYEWNTISGGFDATLGYHFSFNNSGGEDYKIYTEDYYLNHLNRLTEILDKISPNKYIAGPSEMDDLLKVGILKVDERQFIPVEFDDNFLKRVHDYEWGKKLP